MMLLIMEGFLFLSFLCLVSSVLSSKLTELTTRIDSLETTLKKDIRSILDLLHQQQQVQLQMQMQNQQQLQRQQQHSPQQHGKLSANQLYQPSDSEFSFEMCGASGVGTGGGGGVCGSSSAIGSGLGAESLRQRSNVQRSISQPECTNEKTLLR